MILAGDIGGTHARLALFDVSGGQYVPVSLTVFPSHEYPSLDAIARSFVETTKVNPETVCFGIAGPVVNGRVEATNLPWIVDARSRGHMSCGFRTPC